MSQPLLFTIPSYAYLEQPFLDAAPFERGQVERRTFPDGEHYRRLIDDPRGRDVVLLGGTPNDADWFELYDLGWAIAHAGARSLCLVIPYFGYSTMERAQRPGEVVTAKTRARLISAIPPCAGITRVILFDLHTDGIEYYFSERHQTRHVYGAPLIRQLASDLFGEQRVVIGATDAGRAKWVESLARTLDAEPAFVYKRRDPVSGKLEVTGVNADVRGRDVLIYDDMIRTGSSVLQAARAYRDAGASSVHAVASHLVLPNDALDRLLDSGLVESVNGTDSHPGCAKAAARGGRIVSVAGLLAAQLGLPTQG